MSRRRGRCCRRKEDDDVWGAARERPEFSHLLATLVKVVIFNHFLKVAKRWLSNPNPTLRC